MPKCVKRAVLLGIVLAVPHAAWGADSEFPVLNSIGRFWGVGYTRGGYQAALDGRFDIVTNRHPALNYRIGGLPHYSQPLYPPPNASSSASPVVAPTPTKNAQPQDDSPDESSPSDLMFAPPAEGIESAIAPSENADFSIFDAGYPINDHRRRVKQFPVQAPVASPVNRYRSR